MTVIIANDTPPDIRGHLKRWFLEPKPNVFVGTLNTRTYCKVMDFIVENSPAELGMLIVSSYPNCQGYVVNRIGPEGKSGRRDLEISGIHLIAEDWLELETCPF